MTISGVKECYENRTELIIVNYIYLAFIHPSSRCFWFSLRLHNRIITSTLFVNVGLNELETSAKNSASHQVRIIDMWKKRFVLVICGRKYSKASDSLVHHVQTFWETWPYGWVYDMTQGFFKYFTLWCILAEAQTKTFKRKIFYK